MYDFLENDDAAHEWDQAEYMATEAFELYEKGQMQQALEKLSNAIELAPEHSEWYFNAALALDGLEEYEKAIDYYERAFESSPDDVEIMNCLGVNYTRTTRYDLALETFERIEAIDPSFEPSYCNRIIAYTEMEQHDKAEQMFYLAQQINPDCPLCFYNIGNSLFTQGKYERAIWCWDRCADLDPKHPQIHFRLAQSCWISGQGQRAKAEFLAELRHNPTDLEVILEFGLFLLGNGDLEAAKEKFNRILEFDEMFALAKFYLGEVYLAQGNLSAAELWYQRAMDTDQQLAGPRFRLAQIFKAKNELIIAADLLCDEFNLGIEDNDVLSTMGWMLMQIGSQQDAVRCFLKILEQEDSNDDVFFGLAVSLAMGGEYEGALQCLKQAMRLSPDKPELLLCAGWICYRLEKWTHGLGYAKKCHIAYPNQEPWRSQCRKLKRAILFEKTLDKIKAGRLIRWISEKYT
ncbi:MAG: tetratricopeptide repeat protein [Phycisphaerae bacterium]|nr:tetratricopeptide repeat protein [Phycisphaerae bacterium]